MVNPFFLIIHQFSTLFIPSSEKLREIWSRDNIKGSDFHQPASINLYDLKTTQLFTTANTGLEGYHDSK